MDADYRVVESSTNDKALRRYVAGVDRVLGLFDTALQEWADYISFLSRLLKALQNHPERVSLIPRKLTVAKRLAQCLNPSLPSGVHQKALEVYGFIFSFIGENGLAKDLSIYLPGIASTLMFGSISVRTLFLSLVEMHILKLPIATLRPALKALILALLPGLEEETTDDFDRTLQTLNQCKLVFSTADLPELFWQNLFLAAVTSPCRRQGVLAYLNRHLPRLGYIEGEGLSQIPANDASQNGEIGALTTPEPGLLLRCFGTGLVDDQILVQRAFLDLLVTHLPLNSPIFSQPSVFEDLKLLVSAAVGVVLRRDMSLNRRLWSWFLGPETTQNPKTDAKAAPPEQSLQGTKQDHSTAPESRPYFQIHVAQPLIQSLEAMIQHESRIPAKVARPFRIALSLMDRWEIGFSVVNVTFIPLVQSLQEYQQRAASREDFEEVFRSANVFFDGVESTLIWSKLLTLLVPTSDSKDTVLRNLDLGEFIINNFNITEEEMQVQLIPMVSLAMLARLVISAGLSGSSRQSAIHDSDVQSRMFSLISHLMETIPDRALNPQTSAVSTEKFAAAANTKAHGILDEVRLFFEKCQDIMDPLKPPFSAKELGVLFLRLVSQLILSQIHSNAWGEILEHQVRILSLLLEKLHSCEGLDRSALMDALTSSLSSKNETPGHMPLVQLSSATVLLVSLYARRQQNHAVPTAEAATFAPVLVRHLWGFLSFKFPQHHVEAVHLLEDLHLLLWREESVTSTILSSMVKADGTKSGPYLPSEDSLERFITLWTHRRAALILNGAEPAKRTIIYRITHVESQSTSQIAFSIMMSRAMVFVLSILRGPRTEVHALCREWLRGLADLSSIFDLVATSIEKTLSSDPDRIVSRDNIERCTRLMEILSQLAAVQSSEQWLKFSYQQSSDFSERSFSLVKGLGPQTIHFYVGTLCSKILQRHDLQGEDVVDRQILNLLQETLGLLRQLYRETGSERLLGLCIDRFIVARLARPLVLQSRPLQSSFLDTLSAILAAKGEIKTERAKAQEPAPVHEIPLSLLEPPEGLSACLLTGIRNPASQDVVQKWIQILCESVSLNTIQTFNTLMGIVECFCQRVDFCFGGIKKQFQKNSGAGQNFESPLLHLLNGLDFVLARAHEQLLVEENGNSTAQIPEPQQGFFGSIVSGTVTPEAKNARSLQNNNRLTLILCFQDALSICFKLWSWQSLEVDQSSKAFPALEHSSQKLRSRSRGIMEHLLSAEPLESVEVLANIWVKAIAESNQAKGSSILNLLNTLDVSRPRNTITAVFNAIYSRTDPAALVSSQKSTLSSSLQETELVTFMNVYAQTLEDDSLEEIWDNCTAFLRDILGNPMPHRQILIQLVDFIATLSAKMENTNFGEEWKMRRDLAELFVRLLTAIITVKPQPYPRDQIALASCKVSASLGSDSIEDVLDQNFAAFSHLLGESDRLATSIISVVSNVIAPLFRSRQFPQNLTTTPLSLLLKISRISNSSKAWKKELMEALNDSRIFSSSLSIVKAGWLPLMSQLAAAEKGLLPELITRLSAPTAAGIIFGVGATAARLEADKKAQFNLRRLAFLFLAVDEGINATLMGLLQAKLEELLTASSVSSPSSMTRAEIYMVFRALMLKTSTNHITTFWPMINTELCAAFSSIRIKENSSADIYNNFSLLQAAKLLEVLLLVNPEDFQPQAWLFVTDTVDAIYQREIWDRSALADEIAQSMIENNVGVEKPTDTQLVAEKPPDDLRKPWLSGYHTRAIHEGDIPSLLLKPFFSQLSINFYERTYSISDADMEICRDDLMADLFNEHSVVGA